MASTNKTTNYELSQFLGTDKPAWLADYNSDMSKIDAGIHTAQTTATAADGKADSANTAIGTLSNLNTQDKTSAVAAINEANTAATTAQNTANNAAGGVSTINNKLDITHTIIDSSDLTVTTTHGTVSTHTVKVAHNSDGSIAKIYGSISLDSVSGPDATVTVTISGTGLYPTNDITVNGCALGIIVNNSWQFVTDMREYTIHSNGTITFQMNRYTDTRNLQMQFIACIVYVKDFGD